MSRIKKITIGNGSQTFCGGIISKGGDKYKVLPLVSPFRVIETKVLKIEDIDIDPEIDELFGKVLELRKDSDECWDEIHRISKESAKYYQEIKKISKNIK